MSANPVVSAIIIFLNAQRYIEEAIESVLAQTYWNWELLLVDDGSADGSTRIAQRYAQNYLGKIRYLEHEGHANRGMSASRNLGICHARGEFVGFLDADDVWLPHKKNSSAYSPATPKQEWSTGERRFGTAGPSSRKTRIAIISMT